MAAAVTLWVGLSLAGAAWAQGSEDDDAGWGDDDAGWGDDDDAGWGPSESSAPELAPPRSWTLGGLVRSRNAAWVEPRDDPAWAQSRLSVDPLLTWREGPWFAAASLHAEVDPAILLQDHWGQATKEQYGWLVQPRQLRVGRSAGPWTVELGRQLLAAGEGRGLSTLDVFTPRDLREPGLTELEDLRLPVTAARVEWTHLADRGLAGEHSVELVAIPEAWFGMRSPPKGPFGLLPGLLTDPETVANVGHLLDLEQLEDDLIVDYTHLQRRWDLRNLQGFARWTWRGPGLDLGLIAGSALDQRGLLITPTLDDMLTDANTGVPVEIILDHQRYTLLGHHGAAPVGPVILRWELAWKHGLPINTGEGLTTQGLQPVLQVFSDSVNLGQGLLGVSWQGWGNTRVDLDLVQGLSPDPPWLPLFPVTIGAWSARASKVVARDRVTLEATVMGWGWTAQYGAMARGRVAVELRDGLHADIGYIHYRPGQENGPLLGLDAHDRAFLGLRWAL